MKMENISYQKKCRWKNIYERGNILLVLMLLGTLSGGIATYTFVYLGNYDKEKKLVKFYERNYFEVGDKVELFTPQGERVAFVVSKLYDEDMNSLEVARHPDNIYYLSLDTDISIVTYSMIRLIESKKD